jgi:hypothetical protein
MSKRKFKRKGCFYPISPVRGAVTLRSIRIAALGDLTIGTSVGFLLLFVGVVTGTVVVAPPLAVLYGVATSVVAILLAIAGIGLKVYAAFLESKRL